MADCPYCDADLEFMTTWEWLGEETACPECHKKIELEHEYLDYDNITFWFERR